MSDKLYCPITQATATTGMTDNALRHGKALKATLCRRERCAWWSSGHGCCAVLAAVKAEQVETASTSMDNGKTGFLARLHSVLSGEANDDSERRLT